MNAHPPTSSQVPAWFGFHYYGGPIDTCPPDPEQVELAREFLMTLERVPLGKRAAGSYRLKHRVEEWYCSRGRSVYVSNGALIQAAIDLGIPVEQFPRTPNARIGVAREGGRR